MYKTLTKLDGKFPFRLYIRHNTNEKEKFTDIQRVRDGEEHRYWKSKESFFFPCHNLEGVISFLRKVPGEEEQLKTWRYTIADYLS
jgi:hypothetical protein